jgi:hypothetical protein
VALVDDQVIVTNVSRMTELEEADKDEVGLGSKAGGAPPPASPLSHPNRKIISKEIRHVLFLNILIKYTPKIDRRII